MSFDGVELWANSLKQILEWMKSEDLGRVDTGLELFCTIFSKVSEKYRNEKILPETFSLIPIIPKLLHTLLQVLVNLKVTNSLYSQINFFSLAIFFRVDFT